MYKTTEKKREYCQNHKAERAEYMKKWQAELKQGVLDHYSALRGQKNPDGSLIKTPCCGCCQENDLNKLCIDHIQGGGKQHRRELGVGSNGFYLWLRKQGYPEGYQTLCLNCNRKKQTWDDEHGRGGIGGCHDKKDYQGRDAKGRFGSGKKPR